MRAERASHDRRVLLRRMFPSAWSPSIQPLYGRRLTPRPVHTTIVWTEAHAKARPYNHCMDGGSRQGPSIQPLYGRRLTPRPVHAVHGSSELFLAQAPARTDVFLGVPICEYRVPGSRLAQRVCSRVIALSTDTREALPWFANITFTGAFVRRENAPRRRHRSRAG